MYYYFYSQFSSVLKINDIYYGSIDKCIKPIRFDDNNPLFVQACSLCPNEKDVNLLLNEDFFAHPPQNVSLIDLNGGYAIIFNCSYKKEGFFVLAQQKYPYAVVTVFNENGLKISIETANDFYALPIRLEAKNATITPFNVNSQTLITITISADKTYLLIFDISDKIKCLFFRKVDDFSLENELVTTEKFSDIAKHTVKTTWVLENDVLKAKYRVVTQSENFCLDNLSENVLPFAFLEQLYCGGDINEFLSENIKENAHLFNEFFGKFIGVFPPPAFIEKDCVGIIYKQNENVYKVEYFCFEIENGKIYNISKIE